MGEPTQATGGVSRSLRRVWPLGVLVAGLLAFFALDLDRFLSFEALREHREWLVALVEDHGALSALAFLAIYAVVIAFSIPVAAVLTIAAGFLFGTALAALCAVLGATLGATAVFLAARSAFADLLRARAGTAMRRMEAGFRENAFNYLLVLRLIPIFPFWLVNLVPAFLGVPLRTYVLATLIGIVPGTLVYASLGNGLGAILDAGRTPDLSIIFDPEVLLPIVALAVLALLPVVYKRVKAQRGARGAGGTGGGRNHQG